MITAAHSVDPLILIRAQNILTDFFGSSFIIAQTHLLSEPERRNMLLRLQLEGISPEMPTRIILKQCLKDQADSSDDVYSRFARDWAAHEFINQLSLESNVIPKFYGSCSQYNFILIEDFGIKHVSLVDSLTSCDSDKASAALKRFMKTLGQFHAATYNETHQYDKILYKIDPQIKNCDDLATEFLDELISKVEVVHDLLNLPINPALLIEIKTVIQNVSIPDTFRVLTHGDICPDNVFDLIDQDCFKFIDFEFAEIRHALLDTTYLKMAMPTCWCAQLIPQYLIDQLEHIYREEIKKSIPEAHCDKAYFTAYTNACGYWALSTLFSIDKVWDNDEIMPSGPVPIESL